MDLIQDLGEHSNLHDSFQHFQENLLRNLTVSVPNVLDLSDGLSTIESTTKLQHHPYKAFTIVTEVDCIGLEWAGFRVTFPLQTEAAIRFILNNKQFQVSELPDELDEESNAVLVKRLVKEDFLQMVSDNQTFTK